MAFSFFAITCFNEAKFNRPWLWIKNKEITQPAMYWLFSFTMPTALSNQTTFEPPKDLGQLFTSLKENRSLPPPKPTQSKTNLNYPKTLNNIIKPNKSTTNKETSKLMLLYFPAGIGGGTSFLEGFSKLPPILWRHRQRKDVSRTLF